MATNQGFKSFVPDQEILSSDFLYWWLKSNKGTSKNQKDS